MWAPLVRVVSSPSYLYVFMAAGGWDMLFLEEVGTYEILQYLWDY